MNVKEKRTDMINPGEVASTHYLHEVAWGIS